MMFVFLFKKTRNTDLNLIQENCQLRYITLRAKRSIPYLIHKANVSLYSTGATYAAETAYPYAGLKFIHGFNEVLTTLWYLKDLNTFTDLS
jgi:hypothetical protein